MDCFHGSVNVISNLLISRRNILVSRLGIIESDLLFWHSQPISHQEVVYINEMISDSIF